MYVSYTFFEYNPPTCQKDLLTLNQLAFLLEEVIAFQVRTQQHSHFQTEKRQEIFFFLTSSAQNKIKEKKKKQVVLMVCGSSRAFDLSHLCKKVPWQDSPSWLFVANAP